MQSMGRPARPGREIAPPSPRDPAGATPAFSARRLSHLSSSIPILTYIFQKNFQHNFHYIRSVRRTHLLDERALC